ncbi:MAG: peptidylprolyl isomerase [Acidithiobacillus sp.]
MRKLLPLLLLLLPPMIHAQDLASVNGHVITSQEIEALNAAAKSNPQIRNQVLQELINRTLILQAANKEGLDHSPAFQQELARQREQLLIQAAIGKWLDQHPVSAEQIKARYEKLVHTAPSEQWRLREILVKDAGEAQKILGELRQGASFSKLAAEKSIGDNAALGGELGWVNSNQLPAAESKPLAQLKTGEITGPIVVPQGFLIVQLLGRRPFPIPPLGNVQQQISEQLRNEAIEQYVHELRKQSKIVLTPGGDAHVK